jgi:serine/threonine protein kinase/Tol biopolymer transport system component
VKEGLDINRDRWPDVSRVFSAAAPLDGPSRNAYLDEACRYDSALRTAVESLLAAHDNAGSFGEAPVVVPIGAAKRLTPGSQLGPFRIESLLGAGGMGEVYRAHDTKLQRAVAIKVLPDFFAQDPNRLARFEEEARALAALNHPHVGAIYGLEESAGIVALVLELVEGPTLAERLAVAPLAFNEVVWIARQLAEGLEAAHERGIVHRDLKPANIKVTPDGTVKILDFGLAKTAGALAAAPSADSPSVSRAATRVGVIVGTVGYMSPEQARGQAVDKRTDIWAFGCVLFEMCAHQPPFAGATISDAQAAVIEREPDWKLLRAGTPANLVRLLRRCLTKDSKLRLRDIGEARIALEQDADTAGVAPRSTTRRAVAITAILAAAASFAIAFAIFGPPRVGPFVPDSSVRFEVAPPEGTMFGFAARLGFVLSPNGSKLAFLAGPSPGSTRRSQVWVRAVPDGEAQPVSGTEGAMTNYAVVWSRDGLSLAFFAAGDLKRINLTNGKVETIIAAKGLGSNFALVNSFNHGTWGDRVILLGRSDGTLIAAVPEAGGVPVPILSLDRSKGEALIHHPWFLPDGKRFLYTVRLDNGEGEVRLAQVRFSDREGEAQVVQLEGSPRTLMSASSNAQWVNPDVVVFAREGVLMGQRVDLEAARAVGEPFPIAARPTHNFTTSFANFSVSLTGSVAYFSDKGGNDRLVWADRNGNEVGVIGSPGSYQGVRLSPDDSAMLFARSRPGLGTSDIWRHNFNDQTEQRLTSKPGNERSPVWINARDILYAGDSFRAPPRLFRKDGTGSDEPITTERFPERRIPAAGAQHFPMDVFPGGREVVYAERTSGGSSLFRLPLARGAAPTQLQLVPKVITQMRLSPDGSMMTFVDGPLGAGDVYVSTMPVTSPPVLVEKGVGSAPLWSPKGDQIYYRVRPTGQGLKPPALVRNSAEHLTRDWMMISRTVRTVPQLTLGPAVKLFTSRRTAFLEDVSIDGRFLLLVPQALSSYEPYAVWTNAIASTRR